MEWQGCLAYWQNEGAAMKTYTVTAHWEVVAHDDEEAWDKAQDEAPSYAEIEVEHNYEEENGYDEEREWRS